jgi:hypothetical protein
MPLPSALKFRNKNIKATYAIITDNTVTCKTNTPITPFTPVTGLNGIPFRDSETGATYYEYFVDPTGAPLPAGLSLNQTTGQITGTPTATTVVSALIFSVVCRIAVRDSRNRKAYKKSTLTFIVLNDLVAVNTANNKVVGVVNSVSANVSLFTSITGGRPPYVYSVAAGTLPPGVILDQTTGTLTGIATDTKRTFTDASQTEVLPITSPVEIAVEDFYGTKVANHTIVNFDIIDLIIAVPSESADYTITGVIPLSVNFQSFSSVVAGTPPYTFFTPEAQKDTTPEGLALNATTGSISGTYVGGTATKLVGGVPVPDLKEYSGTLKVSVKDSTDAIASKIANVKINAYLHFAVEPLDTLSTGLPQTSYDAVQLKPISRTPFKGVYGVPPYTFRLVQYQYTNGAGVITTSTSLPTGVTLTAATGQIGTTTGLPIGAHEFTLDAIDTTNTVANGFVPITFNVSDAVAATSLATLKSYEMYVGDTSALTTGVEILSAELGIPPYTFFVDPLLPPGLSLATTATKCSLIGTATAATDKPYVFSVKDSTGTSAKVTETITLKIVDHFTSTANVTDVEAFIDDVVKPIDIFDNITGGYPPYTATLLSGTLRPELTIVPMGYQYYDTAQSKNITTTVPQIWGNIMVTGAGTAIPILGSFHKYGYASTDTYTFKITDSRGNESPNIVTINYKIYKKLRGTATRIPPIVTGIAQFTNVSFNPVVPVGGIPPYTINFTPSITDFTKKPPIKTTLPKLGLKTIQPGTIAGVPSAGYKGTLYYYMSDSVGSRTDNIPVKFNITPKISAVAYSAPLEVLYVRGFDKFEITDKTGASPVVTTDTVLKIPFFKSVTGGAVPYVYFESNSTGVAAPTSSLPTGLFIDTFGNLNGDSSSRPAVYATNTVYCSVADNNLVSGGEASAIKLTICDEFSTTLVDNLSENAAAVTSFNLNKSNSSVVFLTGGVFNRFSLVRGKNGSGRYSYMFDLTTPSVDNVLDYFQINGSTGAINLKPSAGGSSFANTLDVTMGIKVTDTFTEIVKVVSNVLRLKVINPMTMSVISTTVSYEKDSIHTNDPVFALSGGSGEYDFVSIKGPANETVLPGSLTFTNTSATTPAGCLTGSADAIAEAKDYVVKYKDRVYNTIMSATVRFSITSDYVIIPVARSVSTSGKTITLANIQIASALSYAQLLSTPIKIRIDIEGEVRSTSVNAPALTINLASGLNSATTIKVFTKSGNIIGCGGKGGIRSSTNSALLNGEGGGVALKLNTGDLVVEVESLPGTFISGGGGGGGAGGDGWTLVEGQTMSVYQLESGVAQIQKLIASGSTQIWSPQGWANDQNRISQYIDVQYERRVNQNSLAYLGQFGKESYILPDPNRPTDPNYRLYYDMYAYPAKTWDFEGGTGFTPQTRKTKLVIWQGSAGGNGFGHPTANSNNGAPGTVSTASAAPIVESLPTNNLTRMLASEWSALISQSPAIVGDGVLIMDAVSYHEITPATPGSEATPGNPGTSPDVTTLTKPYRYAAGLGGGGGGGMGGTGGNGGSASSLPEGVVVPGGVTYLGNGGLGGVSGPAILTTAATDIPTLVTPSLVYGDVY